MHAQPLIERYPHLHHRARSHIPDQRHARQRAGGEELVAIDNVLVAADEDAQDAVAEEHRRDEWGPWRDIWGGGPAHPEERDRDGRGAKHGEPEAEFGGQGVAACGFDAGEVALGPGVDEGDEEGGEAEAEGNAEEGEAGEALGKAVGDGEDEGVAV